MDALFWTAMAGLTVASAGLSWFALQRSAAPVVPEPADRRGFLVVAARHGLQAELAGRPDSWTLQGHIAGRAARVCVVEVDGQRWTELRLRVEGVPDDLRCASRAQGAAGAQPTGQPAADQALAVWGDDGALKTLKALWADEAQLAAWLELLGPEHGAAVSEGWLLHAVEGARGDLLEALVEELVEGARRMGI